MIVAKIHSKTFREPPLASRAPTPSGSICNTLKINMPPCACNKAHLYETWAHPEPPQDVVERHLEDVHLRSITQRAVLTAIVH